MKFAHFTRRANSLFPGFVFGSEFCDRLHHIIALDLFDIVVRIPGAISDKFKDGFLKILKSIFIFEKIR